MTSKQAAALPGVEVLLGWVDEGQRLLEQMVHPLDDTAVGEPSRLPGHGPPY